MRKGSSIILSAVLLLTVPLFTYAEDAPEKPFISKPFMKFGRGAVNMISAPLEIPNQMYLLSDHAQDNSKYGIETASAAIEGLFMGVVYTFWRVGAGAYDLITFPLPKYESCLVTPTYLTISYKDYYEKERKESLPE